MNFLHLLALVFVLLSFEPRAFSEEGGVITGGPNALPTEPSTEGRTRKQNGKIIFVQKPDGTTVGYMNTESTLPEPKVLRVTEEDFNKLAILSVKSKAPQQIYVNPDVGMITPHTVDVLNRKIRGLDGRQITIEIQQIARTVEDPTPASSGSTLPEDLETP